MSSASNPRFSIIGIYYQGVHPPEVFTRGVGSILNQTFKEFELLIYHDGPLTEPVPEVNGVVPEVRCMDRRYNDWGHTLRDRGIREAVGDYILMFNLDNILYPNCLETLDRESRRASVLFGQNKQPVDLDNILIFPIVYHDMQRFLQYWLRLPRNSGTKLIMTGNPPVFGQIDCMQLVMKRAIWLQEGGWKDKSEASDGVMYPRFCSTYGYRGVGEILGEHF
jgi:hypothetical protein